MITRPDEMPDLLLPDELARLIRTTTNVLAQERHNGRGIPFVRHGRKVLYPKAEVLAYLAANTVTPGVA